MADESAYFDTSVLLKNYIEEAGSARARRFLRRYRVLSSIIAPVEAVSAVSRRRRAGELIATQFDTLIARLRADRVHWELVELGSRVLEQAEQLLQRAPLRALDAVHIASALIIQTDSGTALPFATADARQRDGAIGAGLHVLWIDVAAKPT